MENGEIFEADLDLEAEIEAFLEDSDLNVPIWKSELQNALQDQVHDVDILKGIIGCRVLPEELRSQVWPSLLGVRGKSNSFTSGQISLPVDEENLLDEHCRKFGEKSNLAKCIISSYLSSKDLKYDSTDFVQILDGLIHLDLSEPDLYNSFYSILTKFRPKNKNELVSILDLLVQFFDPILSRHIQVRRMDITNLAGIWIMSIFRNCLSDKVSFGVWDILVQSSDSSLSIFICLVFIMNSRDEIVKDEFTPRLDQITLDDLDDLVQLAKFYQAKTPKSFNTIILNSLFGVKNGTKNAPVIPVQNYFVVPISASETVRHVLNATAGIILDIRPDTDFDQFHLIGSLRLNCKIDEGLMDGIRLRDSIEKFSADIHRELAKDDDQEIPFLTLIGNSEPDSTMYTCANELIRIGFTGVASVTGGFQGIIKEVQSIGSEDLLLWRNSEVSEMSSSNSWFSSPISFSSALNSINSTLETILTVDENHPDTHVDDQF